MSDDRRQEARHESAASFEDPQHERLAEHLTVAFRDQAAGIEPSDNAYSRLAEAVNHRPDRRSSAWFRPALAGMAAAALAGAAVLILPDRGGLTVDSGPGSDDPTVSVDEEDDRGDGDTADGEQPDRSSTDGEPDGGETDTPIQFEVSDATGPIRSTPLEAADAFMAQIGLDYSDLAVEDDRIVVTSKLEGEEGEEGEEGDAGEPGPGLTAAELRFVEVAEGFAVISASADTVMITGLDFGGTGDNPTLVVSGEGSGFEATLGVDLISMAGSRPLAETFTMAGLERNEPFEVEVPVAGAEDAWLIIQSSGGADDVTEPFAAIPVSYEFADPTDYSIVRIELDDPDGGLKLRSGPGIESDSIAVVPTGTTGVRRAEEYPVQVGDDVWWSIVTPSGETGWVNSAYLASGRPVPEEDLLRIGTTVAQALPDVEALGELGALDLPLSERAWIATGLVEAPIRETATALGRAEGWTGQRSIQRPAAYGQPFEGSLIGFLEVDRWDPGTVEVTVPDEQARFVYTLDRRAASAYFGDLASVTISSGDTETPWTRTHVYVESTPVGPRIVGIVGEVWQP